MNTRPKHPWLLPAMTLGLAAGILLGRSAEAWQYAAVGLALSLAYTLLGHGRRRSLGAVMTALFIGCLVSWAAYHPVLPAEGDYIVSGVVAQEIALREDGQVRTVLSDVTLDGQPVSGGAYWTYYLREGETPPEALLPGAHVTLAARVYHPGGRENPEGYSFFEALLQQGVRIGVYGAEELTFPEGGFSLAGAFARARYDLSLGLVRIMGEEAGAYATAMLLGSRDLIPAEDLAAFKRLGIAHILSVSGFHVSVLSAMLAMLLRPLQMRRSSQLGLRGSLLAGYCMLTGGHAPVIRAALTSVLWEGGRVRHRQVVAVHVLCLTAAVQLIFSPALLTSASFQLTYSAMIGLLLFLPGLKRILHPRRPWFNRLWTAFSVCLAAQLGLLPAQLYWFGTLPLLSLVLNMFIMTLTTGLMFLYWLTLGLMWLPGVSAALGWLSAQATGVLLGGVRLLGQLEGMELWTRRPDGFFLLGWILLMIGLFRLIRIPAAHRRALLLTGVTLMLTILIPLPHRAVTYIQFSVGEADAAVLRDGDTVTVIDTGEDGEALAGYLHRHRLAVDTLIITHLHSDHAGGIRALLDAEIPVARCSLPADAFLPAIDPGMQELIAELAASGTEIAYLSRGDVITLPSGSLTALWPTADGTRPMQDANHASLVLLARLYDTTLLLTGDLTGTYEGYSAVPADVLKAAHHGSASSTSEAFLTAVDPQIILLSCGDEAREQSLLARAGDIPVYSTDTLGAITLRIDETGFRVEPFLPTE